MSEKISTIDILDVVNTILEPPLTSEQTEIDLISFGVDSIMFIQIIVALEKKYNIEISDEYLLITEMNTISKMVNVVMDTLAKKDKEL